MLCGWLGYGVHEAGVMLQQKGLETDPGWGLGMSTKRNERVGRVETSFVVMSGRKVRYPIE